MFKNLFIYFFVISGLILALTGINTGQAMTENELDKEQVLAQVNERLREIETLQENPELAAARKNEALENKIYVRGKRIDFDVTPIIENGRTLIPIRAVSKNLGADVGWNENDESVIIERSDKIIRLKIGSRSASVNNDTIILDVAAQIRDGRTLVPLRFIGKSLGDSVMYTEETGEIDIGLIELKDDFNKSLSKEENDTTREIKNIRREIGRKLTSQVLTNEDVVSIYVQLDEIDNNLQKAREIKNELEELIEKRKEELDQESEEDTENITEDPDQNQDKDQEQGQQEQDIDYKENGWEKEMYEEYDINNFKQNELFQEKINIDSIDYPRLNAAIFYHTNLERSRNGLETLDHNQALEKASFDHSVKMQEHDFVDHINSYDSKRENPADRARLAGVENPMIAENIAKTPVLDIMDDEQIESGDRTGQISLTQRELEEAEKHTYESFSEEVVKSWMHSDGHRENILNENAVELGCGTYLSNGDIPSILSTQKFQIGERAIESK